MGAGWPLTAMCGVNPRWNPTAPGHATVACGPAPTERSPATRAPASRQPRAAPRAVNFSTVPGRPDQVIDLDEAESNNSSRRAKCVRLDRFGTRRPTTRPVAATCAARVVTSMPRVACIARWSATVNSGINLVYEIHDAHAEGAAGAPNEEDFVGAPRGSVARHRDADGHHGHRRVRWSSGPWRHGRVAARARCSGGARSVIGDSLWWAVATMTTVGYGDHVPVTLAGRLVAAVVMMAGVAVIGAVAAGVALVVTRAAAHAEEQTMVGEVESLKQRIESRVDGLEMRLARIEEQLQRASHRPSC